MVNLSNINVPFGKHPVDTGKYLIATNEIDKLCYIVGNWIDNRFPGAIIHGRPRLGKTRAIKYLIKVLPKELNQNIPMFHIKCKTYKNPSENNFFEDLLDGVGHAVPELGRPSEKRVRLKHFFINTAEKSKQNKIVIFIDDAQKLTAIQYDWLMDVYNELDEYGIVLTTILVGHDELIDRRKRFIKNKDFQIVGRFMSDSYQFNGVKDVEDFKILLEQYDEGTEFPVNSNLSYTQFYFRDHFENGFRLVNYAGEFHDVFLELQLDKGLQKNKEIPMQYVTLSIEYILKNYGFFGENVQLLNKSLFKKAIINSGYIQSELVLLEVE
ncbi:ATP-binding protein [Lysinibacillus fusiformis]|uniref:ATP-binding protein n=1 Tax=Lysinibacillus fusiformis TaxID=28031 RepID=UPI001F4DF172|nr:ATP-binding protein [Lysinibacillus fusiformis]MCK1988215.1 ATP-binding protein [Lysinibacillus fusiformis]